jgi:hypothetical protein
MRRLALLLTIVCPILGYSVLGCAPGRFRVQGEVAATGWPITDWHSKPDGCTRDPFDGLPEDKTGSILTFIWEDPLLAHPVKHDREPEAPYRLEWEHSRDTGQLQATLHTRYNAGLLLQAQHCSRLSLRTEQHPGAVPGEKTSLSGEMHLDCRSGPAHITGDLRFQNCQY